MSTSPTEFFFYLAFGLIGYTYLGYGLLLWGLVTWRKKTRLAPAVATSGDLMDVTLVVPAYNEAEYLPAKLQNCLDQDYPAAHLRFLFVADGSTDGSLEWLQQKQTEVPNLTVLAGSSRLGKVEAINQAMRQISTPFVVFTDANTTLNPEAIRLMLSQFADPTVGAVAGEKRIQTHRHEAAAGSGEGLYWRYESALKRLDARLYSIVGAAGELFALRTALYQPVEPDTLLDDFIISLRIAGRGYRVGYEPGAYALERPSLSVGEEKKRKVRIAAGGFQAIARLRPLLNPMRHGWLSFQYISHRVMRWAVAPFCLPLLFALNLGLIFEKLRQPNDPGGLRFWLILGGLQVVFYGLAWLGSQLENRQLRWKPAFVPYYFVFMNWCAILGYIRFRKGNATGIWEKSRRAA